MRLHWIILLSAAAMVGCRGNAQTPTPHEPGGAQEAPSPQSCDPAQWRKLSYRPFQAKQSWRFGVSWQFMKAGEAVLSSEGIETIAGRPAFRIAMKIRAKGVVNKVHPYSDITDSWLDRASLSTVRIRHSVRQKKYELDERIEINPACQTFTKYAHRIDKNGKTVHHGLIPRDILDMYGALFFLRTQDLEVGKTFDLALWARDKAVPVTATVRKKEHVSVPAGKFECFRLELDSKDHAAAKKVRKIEWWLSTDDKHIPIRLRMEVGVGKINAELETEVN